MIVTGKGKWPASGQVKVCMKGIVDEDGDLVGTVKSSSVASPW